MCGIKYLLGKINSCRYIHLFRSVVKFRVQKKKKKKKVVYNDQIYVSVVMVERLWRQTALRNGLKNKTILGQQKIIIASLSGTSIHLF